jgi:hypothetical protein
MRRYRTHRPHRSCGRFRQAKAAESLIAELIGRNSAAYSANSCASVGASFTSGTRFSGDCARTCDPCRSSTVRARWQPGTNPRPRLIILFSGAWKSAAICRQSCLQRGPASQNISRKFGRSLASCLRNRDPSDQPFRFLRSSIAASLRYCALRVSLRPDRLPAQDSAGHLLPKQDRQAWEVEEELGEEPEEEPDGILFATPGRPAREDLDVGCWTSSMVRCWVSSMVGCRTSSAASLDSAESSPAPSARRVGGLFFSNPPVELRSSA